MIQGTAIATHTVLPIGDGQTQKIPVKVVTVRAGERNERPIFVNGKPLRAGQTIDLAAKSVRDISVHGDDELYSWSAE